MKKLLSLTLMLSFCFYGCSSNESTSDAGGTNDQVAQASQNTNTDRDSRSNTREKPPVERESPNNRSDDSERELDRRSERGEKASSTGNSNEREARERNRNEDRKREKRNRDDVALDEEPKDGEEPAEKISMVAAFPSSKADVGLAKGDLIPEITGEDLEGSEFKLSDYKGKVIMLDFWGDW